MWACTLAVLGSACARLPCQQEWEGVCLTSKSYGTCFGRAEAPPLHHPLRSAGQWQPKAGKKGGAGTPQQQKQQQQQQQEEPEQAAAAAAASNSSGGASASLKAANKALIEKIKAQLGDGPRFSECVSWWFAIIIIILFYYYYYYNYSGRRICNKEGREGTRKTWQQLCSTLPEQGKVMCQDRYVLVKGQVPGYFVVVIWRKLLCPKAQATWAGSSGKALEPQHHPHFVCERASHT